MEGEVTMFDNIIKRSKLYKKLEKEKNNIENELASIKEDKKILIEIISTCEFDLVCEQHPIDITFSNEKIKKSYFQTYYSISNIYIHDKLLNDIEREIK